MKRRKSHEFFVDSKSWFSSFDLVNKRKRWWFNGYDDDSETNKLTPQPLKHKRSIRRLNCMFRFFCEFRTNLPIGNGCDGRIGERALHNNELALSHRQNVVFKTVVYATMLVGLLMLRMVMTKASIWCGRCHCSTRRVLCLQTLVSQRDFKMTTISRQNWIQKSFLSLSQVKGIHSVIRRIKWCAKNRITLDGHLTQFVDNAFSIVPKRARIDPHDDHQSEADEPNSFGLADSHERLNQLWTLASSGRISGQWLRILWVHFLDWWRCHRVWVTLSRCDASPTWKQSNKHFAVILCKAHPVPFVRTTSAFTSIFAKFKWICRAEYETRSIRFGFSKLSPNAISKRSPLEIRNSWIVAYQRKSVFTRLNDQ